MKTTATILTRKEIVAVLIELENKINNMKTCNSPYHKAQLATFMSLRNHFLSQLMEMNKHIDISNKAA